MIEYPEVVCMRDQMRETLIGKRIERVSVEDKVKYEGTIRATLLTQSPDVFERGLQGGTLVGVENVCQTLLLAADTGYTLTLGAIYGPIQFHPMPDTLPAKKRPRLQLDFVDGTHLAVVVNLFGTIRILDEAAKDAYLADRDPRLVTPDSERFTLDGFRAALARPEIAKLSAKKLLTSRMPVYYVDGLGGGYVGEILYRAGIHAKRKLRTMTADEQAAYDRAIRDVTAEAIRQGGRWNEKDLLGQPGRFVPHVCKDTLGQPCPKCTAPIERWIHGVGTLTWDIPTRSPHTERTRLGRTLFGYALALDRWLQGVPMQFLLLDLGHVDLGFDPKNEVLRVYAYLGEDRTPVQEWLAACLWFNLGLMPPASLYEWGHGHKELLATATTQGVNVREWMDGVM